MKRWQFIGISLVILAVWCWALAGPAFSQGRGQGFRPCPYTPYACPLGAKCESIAMSGKVVQVLTETLTEGMYPGMALVLDTKARGRVHVHLGPVWYLERQEFELKVGDEVGVKGVCEQVKDGKLRVIAYELTKGDYLLSLRDSQGRPNWEAWRKR